MDNPAMKAIGKSDVPKAKVVAASAAIPTGGVRAVSTPVAVPVSRRPSRRGRLLYKLLVIFLGLSIVPLVIAGFELIRVGDNYISKESRGVKMGIAQKVAGN